MTHVNVGRARDLLGDVRQALDDAVEAVAEALRLAAREMLRQLSQFADPDDADRDADRDALAPLHRAIKQVRTALAESDPTPGGVDGAQEVLDSLPDLFQNAEDAIRQRLTNERQQLLTSSLMTDDVEGANDFAQDFLVDVTNGREAVRSALTTLSKKALHDARRELQLLDDATTKLRDAVRDRREKSASLLDAIGPEQAIGANPDGALPKHVVQLNGRRAAVRNAAETRPLTAQRLSEGEDDLRKLRLAHAAAVDAIEKLGGANELGSLAQALGGAARIEELQEAFGFSDFGALATLVANLGGKQELSQLLTKFGSQGLKGVCDHLGGGACVGVLLRDGCGGDITQLDQLHGAFSGDFSKLGGLLEKGGLKQAPQALAAILRLGCGGKAGDFKSFCDGYATDEALE
ncbi:MAG TPA: hypothetical protein PLV92_25640, partial [Pirellulaceae bacterium]|nr:hypothetical protein [Pirellulaceae bacterium]